MMKMLTSLGGGVGVATAAVAGVVLVGAIAWVEFRDTPPEVPVALVPPQEAAAPAPQTDDPVQPAAQATQKDDPAPQLAASPQAVEEAPAPRFDEVRREADGTTVIAGRAAPGAVVQVLQNGVEIARATADRSGQFAMLAFIAPDGQGHVLTLLQMLDAVETASSDQIILAPLAPPVVVAEATQAPQPAAEAETAQTAELAEAIAEPTPEAPPATPEVAEAPAPAPDAASESTESVQAAQVPSPGAVPQAGQTEEPSEAAQAPTAAPEAVETAEAVAPLPPATPAPQTSDAGAKPQDEPAQQPATDSASSDSETAQVADTAPLAGADTEVTDTVAQATTAPVAEAATGAAASAETAASDSGNVRVTPLPADTDADPPQVAQAPRVPEKVAVLKATETGVELLNPEAPEVMDNVAIDTISYSSTGDVQLAGRAQTDTRSVRVYLNNDSIVNLPVDAQGRWRGDLPNVDEGIYTLRVDEVDEDGSVTSRVETPFKREAPAVLAAATADLQGPIKAITVQKGATLWAIARDRYGSGDLYVRVFEANKDAIRDPDLIYPGQIFDLPD